MELPFTKQQMESRQKWSSCCSVGSSGKSVVICRKEYQVVGSSEVWNVTGEFTINCWIVTSTISVIQGVHLAWKPWKITLSLKTWEISWNSVIFNKFSETFLFQIFSGHATEIMQLLPVPNYLDAVAFDNSWSKTSISSSYFLSAAYGDRLIHAW